MVLVLHPSIESNLFYGFISSFLHLVHATKSGKGCAANLLRFWMFIDSYNAAVCEDDGGFMVV
ncbi:hypothetical protein HanPSC8_Chr02g0076341 [Helianthus annuus]|nr:hypothetical protein HanPSC8_Chr02g0076341 [Helianthus annuus]